MSKKKFTDTLEDLFGESSKDTLSKDSPLLAKTEVKKTKGAARKSSAKSSGKTGKNFIADLDFLFEDALVDAKEEVITQTPARQTNKTQKTTGKTQPKRRTKKPASGLDALIRRTIDTTELEVNYQAKKRITFVFDREKLDKLKKIARKEKSYLKDLVDGLISEYIDDYESSKGRVEE